MKIEIRMTDWNNEHCAAEHQDVLLTCEHLLMKAAAHYGLMAKATERSACTLAMEIEFAPVLLPFYSPTDLLHAYNRRLWRYHYWNREDEPLVMEWNIIR